MDLTFSAAGLLVGVVVGMTGVGGGALMTPFLIFYGIAPAVAIGTDLVYAALTKSAGAACHARRRTIEWAIVGRLAMGSLPAAALSVWWLQSLRADGVDYAPFLTTVLGGALVLTAAVLLFQGPISGVRRAEQGVSIGARSRRRANRLTVVAGAVLGFLVTLSSVGAGALGAAALMLLYPRLRMVSVVGTDLAHAALLAAIAGVGHFGLGTVDLQILALMALGALPGVAVGTCFATRIPETLMRRLLAGMLMSIGIAFSV